MVVEACHGLSAEDHSSVLDDWMRSKIVLESVLSAKFACWNVLPWKLFGLAHWDVRSAHECARVALAAYDAQPIPAFHHRVSNALLGRGSTLRQPLVDFANGVAREALPQEFAEFLLRLKFAPITERIVEACHSLVKKHLWARRRGAVATLCRLVVGEWQSSR